MQACLLWSARPCGQARVVARLRRPPLRYGFAVVLGPGRPANNSPSNSTERFAVAKLGAQTNLLDAAARRNLPGPALLVGAHGPPPGPAHRGWRGKMVFDDEARDQRLSGWNRRSARWCRLMQGGRPAARVRRWPATLRQPPQHLNVRAVKAARPTAGVSGGPGTRRPQYPSANPVFRRGSLAP